LDKFKRNLARPGSNWPRIRFGAVGRLSEQKDHATLIRAFAQVVTQMPQAELHVLGDGPMRSALEELIGSLKLRDSVTLHGARSESASFFATLDVFVLSSLYEGLPVVALEAMAAGLPIVSTRVGGTPEVAPEGEAAWYCEPASPERLAELMIETGRRTDLAAIGERARKLANERFSISAMADAYERCYREAYARPE